MEHNRFANAIIEELLSVRNWVLLVLSLGLVFLAQVVNKDDPASPLLSHFLRDFGFACFIALLISIFVERASRRKQEDAAAKMQARIAEDVFSGVFVREVPAPLINAVVNQVFKAKVIRTKHTATYVLREPRSRIVGNRKFLELEITSDYTLTNVSDVPVEVPIRLGFPIPSVENAAAPLKAIRIGGVQLRAEEIVNGDKGATDTLGQIRYLWERTIAAQGTLEVVATYTLVKELSDNEIWRSLYPSLGMELNVNVMVEGLECGAHALSEVQVSRLTAEDSQCTHKWALNSPLLPHQAIVFWWRPKENIPNTQK